MKTLVHVVQQLAPGGLETLVLELARFTPAHTDVRIIALEDDRDTALTRWPRLRRLADRLTFMEKSSGLQPMLVPRLASTLRTLRADAVQTHHVGPLLYGGLAARLAGVRTLLHTEHDAWHLDSPRRRRLQGGLLAMLRPRVIADSADVAERLAQAYAGLPCVEGLQVIPNGVDTQYFRPGDRDRARRALGLPIDRPLIGCAGRLEHVKGHDLLIEAVARLARPDVHLAIAGTGSEEAALRRRVSALGLDGRVRLLGRVDDMPRFYQALDLFCLPSRREGMPLAPLEAQACAIPAVVTQVGGAGGTVCPQSGTRVPPEQVEALARALDRALNQPAGGDAARRFVQQHGEIRRTCAAHLALLGTH